MPTQPQFDLRLPTGYALIPLSGARVLLDRTPDDILNLIHLGRLEWAFDIGMPGTVRREIRIYRESLIKYATRPFGDQPAEIPPRDDTGIGEVIDRILPPGAVLMGDGEPCYRSSWLVRYLCCESAHIQNLIKADVFPGPHVRRHQRESRLVFRAAVVAFLTERRVR